jgi:hypothetical protein
VCPTVTSVVLEERINHTCEVTLYSSGNQELTLVLALVGVLFLANREMGQRLEAAVYVATDEQSIHVTWLDT